jgi:hypothetical protein
MKISDEAVDALAKKLTDKCSADVTKMTAELLVTHDTRALFAVLAAEVAFIGATLIKGKVYEPLTVANIIAASLATALTIEVKQPKMMYRDNGEDIGTKQ